MLVDKMNLNFLFELKNVRIKMPTILLNKIYKILKEKNLQKIHISMHEDVRAS